MSREGEEVEWTASVLMSAASIGPPPRPPPASSVMVARRSQTGWEPKPASEQKKIIFLYKRKIQIKIKRPVF
jgi:hypothetical protein